MKKLKGNLICFRTIVVILLNLIIPVAFYIRGIEIGWDILLYLIWMDFFLWLVCYQVFHHFRSDNQKLIVRNSLMPFIGKEYSFAEIKSVYTDRVGYLGRALIIVLKTDDIKAWGISDCSKRDLEEYAQYLNEQIKGNHRKHPRNNME